MIPSLSMSHLLAILTLFTAATASAAPFCPKAHSTPGLTKEQISSRIDSLIAEQVRLQNGDLLDPSLFDQTRTYIENERHRLSQVVPDFEHVYKDRYLALRDLLKQKHKTKREQKKIEEQTRREIIRDVDVARFKPKNRATRHFGKDDFPVSIQISADHKHILTGVDNTRLLIETQFADIVHTFKEDDGISDTEFSHDGKLVFAKKWTGPSLILDTDTLTPVMPLHPIDDPSLGSFKPDGTPSLSATHDRTAGKVHLKFGSIERSVEMKGWLKSRIYSSPDQNLLILSNHANNDSLLVDLTSNKPPLTIPNIEYLEAADFRATGIKLAVRRNTQKESHIVDFPSGKSIAIDPKAGVIQKALFNPNGKDLVLASHNSISIIDVRTGIALDHITFNTETVKEISLNSDGTELAVVLQGWDNLLIIQTYSVVEKL